MKHTTLKTAIVLAAAALSTSAMAAPDIYGQIRMALSYVDDGRPQFNTGNSRIGFKGSEKLNDKTDLEYRLEYKVDVAENTKTNFSARQGYLALNHKDYGRLLVGRTLTEDDSIVTGNAWLWGTGIGPFPGHDADWANNGFLYTSPKFNNGTTDVFVQYGMDEGTDTYEKNDVGVIKTDSNGYRKIDTMKGSRTFITYKDGQKDQISRDFMIVGAHYNNDKTTAGIAYTRAGSDLSALRVGADYQINDQFSVNSTVQYTDFNSSDNELALFGGVAYKPKEPVTTWVELSYTDNFEGAADSKVKAINVGASYDFSKSLLGFANVGLIKETGSDDTKGIEVGAVYRF